VVEVQVTEEDAVDVGRRQAAGGELGVDAFTLGDARGADAVEGPREASRSLVRVPRVPPRVDEDVAARVLYEIARDRKLDPLVGITHQTRHGEGIGLTVGDGTIDDDAAGMEDVDPNHPWRPCQAAAP
jgi:hypothetical protein